jgi:hypothetical protein
MAVRVRYTLKIQISSDPTTEDKDLGNASYEVVSDEYNEGGIREFVLAASSSDVPVAIGNIASGEMFAIRTKAKDPLEDPVEITIKRNTVGNEALPVKPMNETKEGHLLMSTSGLTALFASNPGTVDMKVAVAVVGD